MVRVNAWPERLAEFIESRRRMPFQWGANDCALFAADCVLALTGTDLAADRRGYTTELEAARLVRDAGGMKGLAAHLVEKHIGLVQRGDVVLCDIAGRETFGVFVGEDRWVAPGADGLVFRPMSDCLRVFGY